LHHPAL